MKITITSRKVPLGKSFTERTEKKLAKLDMFIEPDTQAEVTVSQERNLQQIRKNKTRLAKKLRDDAFLNDASINENEQENDFKIVKSKKFSVKPMDVEEAVLQMNLLGHQFYMFRNMDTNEINVVYCRKDGNYGLLEPYA